MPRLSDTPITQSFTEPIDSSFLATLNHKRTQRNLKSLNLDLGQDSLSSIGFEWLDMFIRHNDLNTAVYREPSRFDSRPIIGFTNLISTTELDQSNLYQYGQSLAQAYFINPLSTDIATTILNPDIDTIGYKYINLPDKKHIFAIITMINIYADRLKPHQ